MNSWDLNTVKALTLPRIGQLGFVVRDIEASLPFYSSFYNLDKWFEPVYVERRFEIDGEQVELDLQYIRQQSIKFDIALLLKTIPAVLTGKGAY